MPIRSLNGLEGDTNIYVNSVSAGVALNLTSTNNTSSVLNLDISKQSLKSSPVSSDLFVLEESGGVIKKVSYTSMISGIDIYTGTSPILINTSTNVISLDTVPINKGGTGITSLTASKTISTNSSGVIEFTPIISNNNQLLNGSAFITKSSANTFLINSSSAITSGFTFENNGKSLLIGESEIRSGGLNISNGNNVAGGFIRLLTKSQSPSISNCIAMVCNDSQSGVHTLILPVSSGNDVTDTLVSRNSTDTLTNKSISDTQITGKIPINKGGTNLSSLTASKLLTTDSNGTIIFTDIITNTNQLTNGNNFLSGTVAISSGGTGITSLVASKTISTDSNGAITFTPIITNNNQLTNGSGYISSALSDIISAVNVSTSNILGAPDRTFSNALCDTIIKGSTITQLISSSAQTKLDSNGLEIKGSLFLNHAVTSDSFAINILGDDSVKTRIQLASSSSSHNPVLQLKSSGADTEAYIYSTSASLFLLKGTMNISIPQTKTEGIRFLDNTTEIMKVTPSAITFSQDLLSSNSDIGTSDNAWEDIYCEDIFCEDVFIKNDSALGFKYSINSSAGNQSEWSVYQSGQLNSYRDLLFAFRRTPSDSFVGAGYINAQSGSFVLMNFTGSHLCMCNNTEIKNNIDDYIGLIVYSTGEYNSIVPDSYTDEDLKTDKEYETTIKKDESSYVVDNKLSSDYGKTIIQPEIKTIKEIKKTLPLKDENTTDKITINEAQPIVDLTTSKMDRRVYGVISAIETGPNRVFKTGSFSSIVNSKIIDKRLYINSIGEGGIWIVNTNGNFENGDFIQSSNLLGLGEKQDDDLLHNYTVAKITCSCNFDLNYVEFIDNGITYRKVFVGCSYHCG